MVGRMPVLRQHDMRRRLDEAIDGRNDFVSAVDCECAARAEVVLHIDDDQGFVSHGLLAIPSRTGLPQIDLNPVQP